MEQFFKIKKLHHFISRNCKKTAAKEKPDTFFIKTHKNSKKLFEEVKQLRVLNMQKEILELSFLPIPLLGQDMSQGLFLNRV